MHKVTPEYYVAYPVHLTLYWLESMDDAFVFTNMKEKAQKFRLQEAVDIADELCSEYDRQVVVYRDKKYSTPEDKIQFPKKLMTGLQLPEED